MSLSAELTLLINKLTNLKNKIEFENNLWVAEIDATHSNSSEEERIKFLNFESNEYLKFNYHYELVEILLFEECETQSSSATESSPSEDEDVIVVAPKSNSKAKSCRLIKSL